MSDARMIRKCWQLLVVGGGLACLPGAADRVLGQETPAPKPPRIALVNPLSLLPGQKSRVTLRGWLLKDPVAVLADSEEIRISVISHAAAAVPGRQKADQIGDEQLELDIEVPPGFSADATRLRVRTAAGESQVYRLPIDRALPVASEQEPNDGFRQPQQVTVPQLVVGSIHADSNVDVFAFDLSQPGKLRLHVEAAALGSTLDSVLTLWTAAGTFIASNDDRLAGESSEQMSELPASVVRRDSQLNVELPAGRYLLTLQDAFDRGGPAHPYRLYVQQSPDTSMIQDAKP